ncbi:MAG: hypothetical protein RR740_00610 [Pseudomonas sp.]
MTDKNIHDASNKLIAEAFPGPAVIGTTKTGHKIHKLVFEKTGKGALRAICHSNNGENDFIADISEAVEFTDLRSYLAKVNGIGLKYSDLVYAECQRKWEEFESIEAFNQAARDLSPGMINQFQADGVMYSIVHNPAFKMRMTDDIRLNPEFYTVYAQNSDIDDPDECLIWTDSVDTLYDATVLIRTHIEKRLLKTFMPEFFQ